MPVQRSFCSWLFEQAPRPTSQVPTLIGSPCGAAARTYRRWRAGCSSWQGPRPPAHPSLRQSRADAGRLQVTFHLLLPCLSHQVDTVFEAQLIASRADGLTSKLLRHGAFDGLQEHGQLKLVLFCPCQPSFTSGWTLNRLKQAEIEIDLKIELNDGHRTYQGPTGTSNFSQVATWRGH